MRFQKGFLILAVAASFLAASAFKQHPKRLRSPATVKGFIGGESHNTYAVDARQGQTLTVRISWKPEADDMGKNHAEFSVSDSPSFGGELVTFGNTSNGGKTWSGQIPKTGTYYIYVMAHPTARYTLKVTTK